LKERYNVAGVINEKMGGVTSYQNCKILLKEVQNDWASVLNDLKLIRTTLLDKKTFRDGLIINLTGDEDVLKAVQPSLKKFIDVLPDGSGGMSNAVDDSSPQEHPWFKESNGVLSAKKQSAADEALIVPTQVSYVVKGNKIYKDGEKINGSSSVVTTWLSRVYLWNTVRIQGNAYGASANLDDEGGVFACSSYRDPNIISTLKFYDGVVPFLKEQVSEFQNKPNELESAIIGAISQLEGSPPSNSAKGFIAFNRWLLGYTTESRQKWRDEILSTQPEHFEEFASRLEDAGAYSTVIVTSGASYESAKLKNRNIVRVNVL